MSHALLDEFPGPEAPQLVVDLSDMLRQVQPHPLLLQPPVQQQSQAAPAVEKDDLGVPAYLRKAKK